MPTPTATPKIPGMDMLTKAWWLGPVMALGGAALFIHGSKAGAKSWMKFAGGSMAASGLLATYMGASAKGAASNTKKNEQLQQAVMAIATEADKQIAIKNQEIEQLKGMVQQGGAPGQGGQPGQMPGQDPGQGQMPGQNPGQTPGQTGTDPNQTGQLGGGLPGLPGSQPQGTGQPGQPSQPGQTSAEPPLQNAPVIATAQWTPAAILGSSIAMQSVSLQGVDTADAGRFVLRRHVGEPAGYSSVEAADAAAFNEMRPVMSTENYRWIVVEHGGKYYAYEAVKDTAGAPMLPASNGNLIGWHSLSARTIGKEVPWIHTSWKQAQTPVAEVIPEDKFGNPLLNPRGTGAGAGTGSEAGSVSGGGPVAVTSDTSAVRSALGSGFTINASGNAQGGFLQIQTTVGNSGYATPGEAAQIARGARDAAGTADAWKRWIVVKGNDGKYYPMQGSIVSAATKALDTAARPMFVFGAGFGEHFDGSQWKASAE